MRTPVHEVIATRFLEACVTGEKLSHRLNLRTCGFVMRRPDTLREAIKLDVHPLARSKFLEEWVKVTIWQKFRGEVGDDDLWFATLRKLLPPYEGPPMQLYRGQRINEPIGVSWTRSLHIAEMFAMYGTAVTREIRYANPREGKVLSAVMHSEIICAPCLLGHEEGEFIVDPRNVSAIASRSTQVAEASKG